MTRINYKNKQLLDQNQENTKVEFMVEKTSLDLQQDVIATKARLEEVKESIKDVITSYPLDVAKYMELTDEKTSLESGLVQLNNLQKELGFIQ